MNSKIKLALAAASAAGAAASLIGQMPALAGGLTSTQTNNFGAAANYNLTFGGGLSATGNTVQTINPFAGTTGSRTSTGGAPSATTVNQSGFTEGNAGTSTLTAAFDQTGFATGNNTASNLSSPSFAIQAGIINVGGEGATGNVTTASGALGIFTTPSVLAFNLTGANSATSISLTGAGQNNGVLAATFTGTDLGASSVQGNLIQGLSVISTISAF